ncbi:MAG: ribonuclease HII [Magnetococcales bacterium]|nr:ribonuclease HII [Magnetococcales bacterium]
MPGTDLEQELAVSGCRAVCGVDEAGRGPLCGPVVAAAVILAPGPLAPALAGLDDSKRLTPQRRELLAEAIRREAMAVGVGLADPDEIDRLNIRRAALLAMSRAVAALPMPPDFVLVDGRDLPDALPAPARAVVRGDRISASIAAASIIAKTHRDGIMTRLASRFPGYGWEENAGYPTSRHLTALRTLGVTEVHRRSFGPVAALLAGKEFECSTPQGASNNRTPTGQTGGASD